MKKIIKIFVSFIFFFYSQNFGQNSEMIKLFNEKESLENYENEINQSSKMFSKFKLSILGGINFNTIPTIGGYLQFEGKTNINSKINLKISVGYSGIFENKEYIIKTYSHFKIENDEGYILEKYYIDEIQYNVIPLNLGIEYFFTNKKISPFAIFELGYNFYNSEEQISKSIRGPESFDNINDIPIEYRNPQPPKIFDDSTIGVSLGLGINYKIFSSLECNIRYLFKYYDDIINTNQILFGITF